MLVLGLVGRLAGWYRTPTASPRLLHGLDGRRSNGLAGCESCRSSIQLELLQLLLLNAAQFALHDKLVDAGVSRPETVGFTSANVFDGCMLTDGAPECCSDGCCDLNKSAFRPPARARRAASGQSCSAARPDWARHAVEGSARRRAAEQQQAPWTTVVETVERANQRC